MILDGKSSQEYPVNGGVCQGSILGLTLFVLYNNDLADNVICVTGIYVDDTTLYSKCDHASDLWQQLELTFEFESDLQDTVDLSRKCLLISLLEKLKWFHLTGLITLVLLMWKLMGLFLRKNHLSRLLGLTFSLKLDWGSYIISVAKTTS